MKKHIISIFSVIVMVICMQVHIYAYEYPAYIEEQIKAIYEADDYENGTQIKVKATRNYRKKNYNYEVIVEQPAEVKYRVAAIAEDTEKFYKEYIENIIPEGSEDWMFRREMAIIQYLVANTRYAEERYYSNTNVDEDYSAYGALRLGESVCAGYASAFYHLATRCNLEVRTVSSKNHAWNLIKLDDGQWYNVDVTWEDPVGGNNYGYGNLRNKYINLTDAEIVSRDKTGAHNERTKNQYICNSYTYGPDKVSQYMRDEKAGVNKQRYNYVKSSSEGWQRDSYGWWYIYTDGSYPSSTWLEINNNWYYFNSDGYICRGWKKEGNDWYYLREDGSMAIGWVYAGGDWYYMMEDGSMMRGWVGVAGHWYYMDFSGKMLVSTITPDGYRVGADGILIN